MPEFRPPSRVAAPAPLADLLAIGQLIDDVMRPGHFFAAPELRLTWIAARAETIPWEIFRGHLLDAKQTREQMTFLAWHVIQDAADVPLISVKFDVQGRRIHVTRALLCHVWTGYDAGGGSIESREILQWTRELVGTIWLSDFVDAEALRDELICLLWQAVVGTSRLPLTSVEAPLPAFVFGQLHYLYQVDAAETPITSWEAWVHCGLRTACAWREFVKLVEFALRCMDEPHAGIPRLLGFLTAELPPSPRSIEQLMRALFNDVSLTPLTHFADNALSLGAMASGTDFLSHLLRQLCRHLSAYDLVTFHHRGANYPDALLLDAALKHFISAAAGFDGSDPKSRGRRRALRQACLLRRTYEGHLVPDLPTSPGENARVMPASHPRVPEEQLTQTTQRRRELFVDEPLPSLLNEKARWNLAQSVRDLEHLEERVEMGLGLFIDRPLGYGKDVGEPDLTPLLAHEAFSPSLARRRWRDLKKLCADLAIPCDIGVLDPLFENGPWPTGLSHAELADCPRPTAALADVRKVADDFVILRTLPGGWEAIRQLFDLRPLASRFRLRFLEEGVPGLCAQTRHDTHARVFAVFDASARRRLELLVDPRQGYVVRAGTEWPRAGLRVITVWEDTDFPAALARHSVDLHLAPYAGFAE